MSGAELLGRAESLVPVLADRAQEAECLRRIPDETVADLRGAGLIRIAKSGCVCRAWPRLRHRSGSRRHTWSRLRVDRVVLQRVGQPQLDRWDVSAAGATGVLRELPGCPLVLGLCRGQSPTRADGRWIPVGRSLEFLEWRGCRRLGNDRREPSGPGPGLCLIPRSEYRIDDNWFVSGLKGTGSKDLVIETPTVVPRHRFLSYASMVAADTPGRWIHARPTYRVSMYTVLSYTLVWPLVGMADGAVRDFERQLPGRTSITGQSLAESPSVQVLLAESAIDVACAYAMARQDLAFVIERGRCEEPLTDLEIARTRANQSYIARLAVRATNRLFEVSGGHALFDTSAIQRFHRDVNAGHIRLR